MSSEKLCLRTGYADSFRRSALLRAGLRRREGAFFLAYPALIPQRASAPSETYRATIGRPWRD
jgi:hypothetical protein